MATSSTGQTGKVLKSDRWRPPDLAKILYTE